MRRDLAALDRQVFDLVILGGGITGAGVALDASLRGLRVALLERGDFASGTSSISSKLVHGGSRYLEQGHLGLVREALLERRRLLRNAPHLVWPLPFAVPFYRGARVPGWKFRAGMLLYDLLAGPGNLHRSRSLGRDWLLEQFPLLNRRDLVGGAGYHDAGMDDARLVIEVLQTAVQHGARVTNYLEAVALEQETGQVRRVRALDRISGRELTIEGKAFLNATGPWSDHVRRLAGEPDEPLLAPTKGVHLVAPGTGSPVALLLLHPQDGRVFFVLPWLGKTLIGTTDTELTGTPDEVVVTEEDITYLLEGYNCYFRPGLDRQQLLGWFAGTRPLVRARPGDPSSRSREYRIEIGSSGLINVVGGKYTTYRHMAEVLTDKVCARLGVARPCRTHVTPLAGTLRGNWNLASLAAEKELASAYALPRQMIRHLVKRYGQHAVNVARLAAAQPELARPIVAGEPDLHAELVYQRDQEMAITPSDALLRRCRLGLFYPDLIGSMADLDPPFSKGSESRVRQRHT